MCEQIFYVGYILDFNSDVSFQFSRMCICLIYHLFLSLFH